MSLKDLVFSRTFKLVHVSMYTWIYCSHLMVIVYCQYTSCILVASQLSVQVHLHVIFLTPTD